MCGAQWNFWFLSIIWHTTITNRYQAWRRVIRKLEHHGQNQHNPWQILNWIFYEFQPCMVQWPAALEKKRWGGNGIYQLPWVCVRNVESVWIPLKIWSHIVTSQMPWKWRVCGRRPWFSRQMQAHKMDHPNVIVFRYRPILAVNILLLGMEVSMYIQSFV